MEEQIQETQNVDQATSEESADITLDSFLGGDTESTDSTESTDIAIPDKEAKKQRDFEKAFFKEKEERRKLEAELAQFRQPSQASQELTPESFESDPGVKLLQTLIDNSIKSAVAPLTEERQRKEQEQIWSEYSQDPIFKTLAPQIKETYAALPKTGNFKQDLDFAYHYSKGKYADDISRAAREVGQEEGYRGRVLKQSGGIVGRPTTPRNTDDFAKRYREGSLSVQEMRERASEIAEIDKQDKLAGI